MNPLRNSNTFFILLAVVITLLYSCAKDDSFSPNADDRERYLGNWICKETVQGQTPTTFTITVSSFGDTDTLQVKNFNQLGASTSALWLVSDNSITIPAQQVTQVALSGFGFYKDGKLDLTYTADGESVTADCTR